MVSEALDLGDVLDASLAHNGGPTLTHALLSGSPAVNAGKPGFQPDRDDIRSARGRYARVTGGRVDIGAFEFGSEFQNVVSGRHIFYNNSSFNAQGTDIGLLDRFAIDPTKQALLPSGSLADAANITSYSPGSMASWSIWPGRIQTSRQMISSSA